jgi:CRP-like cAMP-binding protein
VSRSTSHRTLAELDLFSTCTKAELELAGSVLTLLFVREGDVIVREGTVGREFLIIADGLAAVSRSTPAFDEPLATLRRGELIGEMALLHGVARSATVTTIAPTAVYAGNTREFATLLAGAPCVAERIRGIAAARRLANQHDDRAAGRTTVARCR